ncbi:ATP-binding protein [Vulcanisaeta distributa]|uniref:AAA ATPase n=1 Tax=Vulcanisaeta distributa (strain DSM 14429 / JCM 11212 / NBRC 100878 / IC-017) TaxID=572478 RepID=E1QSR2_VULDI|nr:ATP-binding protein [Vulcanisaeta distributa]ADN49579.1 AAA ATPase [Vulcanisaeta distributa DSM 14429]
MQSPDLMARAREIEDFIHSKGVGDAVIGRVTMGDYVSVGVEGHRIIIDVPFNNYVNSGIRVGDFLGIATIIHRTLVLGRVTEVRRSHVIGFTRTTPVLEVPEDYTGIATPATVMLEPLTECPMDGFEACDPSPVHTPIDPLSIVFRPTPTFIKRMLQLPSSGVLIGWLYSGGRVVRGVDVLLPEHVLYEHMLVVGTTGSGKTVLLKNLALSILSSIPESTVVALDLQGDYPLMALPPDRVVDDLIFKPVDSLTIVAPITRDYLRVNRDIIEDYGDYYVGEVEGSDATLTDVEDPGKYAQAIGYGLLRALLEQTYGGSKIEVDPRNYTASVRVQGNEAVLDGVEAVVTVDGRSFRLRLIPWALSFSSIYRDLPRVFPVFSQRVSLLFPKVIDRAMDYIRAGVNCEERVGERGREKCRVEDRRQGRLATKAVGAQEGSTGIDELLSNDACIELAAACMKLAPSQRDNIFRGLSMIGGLGIMDVRFTSRDGRYAVVFNEPSNYADVLRGLVILDLRLFRENPGAASIIVYRFLSRVFEERDNELRGGRQPRPTFIMIDEAHNYFPQTVGRGDEDFNKDTVETMINKLTRLGRVRRIGVIFATHTPGDLNDLILQLTNTKVALRSEVEVLERVGLREYAGEIMYAQDGVAVVRSYALRTHAVMIKAPPQVRHRSHK